MRSFFAIPIAFMALAPFQPSVKPLSPRTKSMLVREGVWHRGCPVALSGLRLLTVPYHGFDHRTHKGNMVVRAQYAPQLGRVFRRLYDHGFVIRNMSLAAAYQGKPVPYGDVTASFECRQAVPSPCVGGTGTGTWSEHAFGEAVDVNPVENPYVGCGQSRDPHTRPYFNRKKLRRGMVTPFVIRTFASLAGYGWGGAWTGDTKDYMHFSQSGH
jgi:D-alanyl-D-alanine carboxypeptidase-like protein